MLAFAVCALLAQAPATEPPSPVPQPASSPSGSKVWIGRYAEFEEFLRAAPIDHLEDVPIGVTKPRRAFFKPGGLARSAIVKKLRPGFQQGYWESYKSEIAAYEMDKILQMDMVPVTVERRVEGELMSAQLWVEDCQWLKKIAGRSAPDVSAWNRQVYRHRVFDNLIANTDRNAGNLLVDPLWNLILVDHSRAFTSTNDMPFLKEMNRIDRPFFERLQALDFPLLKERLGRWVLDDGWLRALLKRRDRIVATFQQLAAQKGEAEVFVP
jgi:Phosphatidylinositol 3- and 4-kinase